MTTIRAHVPVETPAGLLVALPLPTEYPVAINPGPLQQMTSASASTTPGVSWTALSIPDEFDLAVPCPHDCERFGGKVPGRERGSNWDWVPCWCDGTGWVLHAQFRVIDVLRITDRRLMPDRAAQITVNPATGRVRYRGSALSGDDFVIDLPNATPGGVALVVESVNRSDHPTVC